MYVQPFKHEYTYYISYIYYYGKNQREKREVLQPGIVFKRIFI